MINSQQFDFQGPGPDLAGDWKNYKTGQTVKIKDTIFEDNNLMGVTYDGRVIPMSKLQDFVKYDPSKEPKTQPTPKPSTQSNNDTLLRGLSGIGEKPTYTYEPTYAYDGEPELPTQKADPDIDVIHRILDGLGEKELPVIDVHVRWDVPKGVSFLTEYLHVDGAKIADEVMKKFASVDDIRSTIRKNIEESLGCKKEEPAVISDKSEEVEDLVSIPAPKKKSSKPKK